jgi:hypothetical protein
MYKVIILYSFLFICSNNSIGQERKITQSVEPKIEFSTKNENVNWILEKLNTYSLNNIAFKCDNKVYDKYSNFNVSFDEVTNELIIKYEYIDTINNFSSSYLNKIKIENFKRIQQAKKSNCENEKYFEIETKCKCIEVKVVSIVKGQTVKDNYNQNKIYFYFDSITEKDILTNLNNAIQNLKKFERK